MTTSEAMTATPTPPEVAELAERTAERSAGWLARENGEGLFQQVLLAVVKPLEELGEVLEAIDADSASEAANECADVIISACTAQAALGYTLKWGRALSVKAGPIDGSAEAMWSLIRAVANLGGPAIIWTSQNPRKRNRDAVTPAQISDHLDAVIQAATSVIGVLGFDVAPILAARLAKFNTRLDEMGVPR